MKTSFTFLLLALLLAGCVTTRVPPEVAHIKLGHANSPVVYFASIRWEFEEGRLAVAGELAKRYLGARTTRTHLVVTLFDRDNQVLRRTIEQFYPRQIPNGHRAPGYSRYLVVVEPLPPGTERIEVRASEGKDAD